jgi:hypothetical protein
MLRMLKELLELTQKEIFPLTLLVEAEDVDIAAKVILNAEVMC